MKTFTGKYNNGNFTYSSDTENIRIQLLSILNTPLNSRYYYPDFGSNINEYRFNVLNHFSINIIGSEIKRAVSLIDGITLTDISYTVEDTGELVFSLELTKLSNIIRFSISIHDGVVS